MDIGLVFNTKVLLFNGMLVDISEIVENKLPVTVLSYNQISKKLEPSTVIDWAKTNNVTKLTRFVFNNSNLECSLNYKIYVYGSFSINDNTHRYTFFSEKDRWVSASEIDDNYYFKSNLENDTVFTKKIEFIRNKISDNQSKSIYSITVENNHNFYANNILVYDNS